MQRCRKWKGLALAPTMLAILVISAGCSGPRQPAPLLDAPQRQNFQAIPIDGKVVVRRGDSIYAIAARYGVPPTQIIRSNGIGPPYLLKPGQVLVLPQPREHRVRRGDTLYSIAQRYSVSQYQLARINGLQEPFEIHVGQRLALPGRLDFSALDNAPARTGRGGRDVPTPTSKPERRPSGSAGLSPSKPGRSESVPVPTPRTTITAPSGGDIFRWPVNGKIISEFGPAKRGVHNDGVNIAAPAGTAVRASSRGRVAFVGRGVKSFGTLILIKHDDGIITAYAHLDRVHVQEGDLIDGGQQIATVGQTGKVQTPQLHFEIRKSREPVDPRQLIS